MCRLQCLIKLKASPWGNWNSIKGAIDLVAAATKKCHIKPSGKQLNIIGGTGLLNTVILIGIYCTGHSTTCWANDPESFESLRCIKKKFRCKNNHTDGGFSILEWEQIPWDIGGWKFSFLNNALWVSPHICIFFYNHLKTCLLIISHRAFTVATFKRIKLMKHSNFYILTSVLWENSN